MNEIRTRRVPTSIGGVAAGCMAALLINAAVAESNHGRDRGRNTVVHATPPTIGTNGVRNDGLSATAALPATADLVDQTAASLLAHRIKLERSVVQIDEENRATANAAMADALALIRRAEIGGSPRVMFSDDGILTLQWQRGEFGVALIFAGDGEASIAFRRPGQFYAENGIEVAISQELPSKFSEALATILS